MNKQKLIIRHDDYDFRMTLDRYVKIHEKFIANNLVETAVIQLAQFNKLPDFEGKKLPIVEYMNAFPNWDLQIHCWSHDDYGKLVYDDIVRDMSAALFYFQRLFNKLPTIWFPPRNVRTYEMERAAKTLNLEINNESMGIKDFVKLAREGVVKTKSLYFHGWKDTEMEYFDEMIRLVKKYDSDDSKLSEYLIDSRLGSYSPLVKLLGNIASEVIKEDSSVGGNTSSSNQSNVDRSPTTGEVLLTYEKSPELK